MKILKIFRKIKYHNFKDTSMDNSDCIILINIVAYISSFLFNMHRRWCSTILLQINFVYRYCTSAAHIFIFVERPIRNRNLASERLSLPFMIQTQSHQSVLSLLVFKYYFIRLPVLSKLGKSDFWKRVPSEFFSVLLHR